MKKLIMSVVLLATIFFLPVPAFAQTSTSTTGLLQIIAVLTKQILQLQTQVVMFQAKLRVPQGESPSTAGGVGFARILKLDTEGDDVREIQELLSLDSLVYPEGRITGYYGPLTEAAVRRFQIKHKIVTTGTPETTGFGQVGPRTFEMIKIFIKLEKSDSPTSSSPTRLFAPATTNAPITTTQTPPAVTPTPVPALSASTSTTLTPTPSSTSSKSTADTISPAISNILASNITQSSATITWTTNEYAIGLVTYSASANMLIALTMSGNSYSVSHSVTLNNLSSDTTYYFKVTATDASGNTTTSTVYPFATLPTTTSNPSPVPSPSPTPTPTPTPSASDTTEPTISSLTAGSISETSATLTWMTNESASGKVLYSTTSPIPSSASTTVGSSGVTSHSVTLSGLIGGTTYYYIAVSTDASGNTATSSQQSFTTVTPTPTPPSPSPSPTPLPSSIFILESNCSLYFVQGSSQVLITTDNYACDPADSAFPDFVSSGSTYGLTWDDGRLGTEGQEIYFRKLDGNGQSLTGDVQLTNTAYSRGRPSIAWTGSQYGIVWQDSRDSGTNQYEIYFVAVTSNGVKSGSEVRVTNCVGHCGAADLSWNSAGYFDLTWIEGGVTYSARLNTAGAVI